VHDHNYDTGMLFDHSNDRAIKTLFCYEWGAGVRSWTPLNFTTDTNKVEGDLMVLFFGHVSLVCRL